MVDRIQREGEMKGSWMRSIQGSSHKRMENKDVRLQKICRAGLVKCVMADRRRCRQRRSSHGSRKERESKKMPRSE